MPEEVELSTEVSQLQEILKWAPREAAIDLPGVGWLVVKERRPGPHDSPTALIRTVLFLASADLQAAVNPSRQPNTLLQNTPLHAAAASFPRLASAIRAKLLESGEADVPGVGTFSVKKPRHGRPGTTLLGFLADPSLKHGAPSC
jgi:hypothetical protein